MKTPINSIAKSTRAHATISMALGLMLLSSSALHAANVTWSLAGNATAGGTGNWTGGNTWWNGSSGVAWVNGDNATFSAASTVTVNSNVTAGMLTYSNSTSNSFIQDGAGNLTINNGITATNTANTAGRTFFIDESVILGGNNTWTVNNGGSTGSMLLAVRNAVSGGFGITKAGNGTLSVSGNNTYTGATVVNGGNFQVANNGQLGGGDYAGDITIASGATFTQTSALNQTYSGVISGAGTFNKSNSGTLNITGLSNSVASGGTISQGVLNLTGNLTTTTANQQFAVAGNNATDGASGPVLNITGNFVSTSAGARDLRMGNAGVNNTNSLSGTINLSGSGSVKVGGIMIGEDNGGNGTYNQTGGTTTVNDRGNGWVYLSGFRSDLNVSGGYFTANRTLLGAGVNTNSITTLTVNGTGTVVTPSLYFGFANRNATAMIVNIGDGSLGGNLSVDSLTYNAGASAGSSTINFNGGTFTANNTFSMLTQVNTVVKSGGAIINVVPTKTFTIGTNLTDGGGGGGLTKEGTGTLTLSGSNNTYTGTTTVNAGTLQFGANQTLGAIAGAGALNLSTFNLVTNASTNTTYSGVISGSGALTKAGSGTLTLSGNNSYTGATTISAGTVSANNIVVSGGVSQLGNAASAVTLGSAGAQGTLAYTGNNATYTRGLTIGGAGGGRLNVTTSGQTLTVATGAVTGTGLFTVGGDGNTIISSNATHNGGLTKEGAGTLTLSGANSYTGATTINAGTVSANNIVVSGGLSQLGNAASAVTLGSAGAQGTLAYTGNSATYTRGLTIGGAGGGRLNVTTSGQTLTVATGAVTGTGLFTVGGDGNTIISSDATHSGGLTKEGAGTLTLSGTNTYSGTTTISGGTLKLASTGSIINNSVVSLGTIGTFDVSEKTGSYTVGTLVGSGTVIGNLTVSTQLAIGNSPGTTTFNGDLTLGASSSYIYDLTGGSTPGSADIGDVSGSLYITGAILDLVQLGTFTEGNKFTLFAYDGSLSGTFKNMSGNTILEGVDFLDAGGYWKIDYDDTIAGSNGGTGTYFVTITAVPEPNVAALLGGLGLLALLRRRR